MDLLRHGGRPPWTPAAATDYFILVSHAAHRPQQVSGPFRCADPLPTLPVPLGGGDPDVLLPLDECLNQAYDDAGYDRELDYRQPPNPPLAEPDATWARECVLEKPTRHPRPPLQGEHP